MIKTSRIEIEQGTLDENYVEIRYGSLTIVVDCEGDPETDGVRIYGRDDFVIRFDLEFRNIPGFKPPKETE